jgi:zinc protease
VRRLFACLAAALALSPLAQAAPAKPPSKAGAAIAIPPITFKTRVLANGLKVLYAQDRSTPDVAIQVWYGVGAKDDPAGRSGFAHLFEHLMFKATRDMPAETMDRLTEDVGGANNASTWDDLTNYFEVVPANNLERLLWAEAERMSSLNVSDADFKSERQVVEEELRQRVLADPYGRFTQLAIPQASFTTHPYKRPAIGSIADLEAANLNDVRAFHATYYRPDNAVLIVVGNFDPHQLNAWVDRYFRPIRPPNAALPRVTVKEPPRSGAKTVTVYGPNVPLPAVAITWLAVSASHPDAPALNVLDAILTGGDSSRLFQALVYRERVALKVFSDADLRQQPGMVYVGAMLADGKTPQMGEQALLAEIANLKAKPISAPELARAKNELITQALRERETVEGRGFDLGQAYWIEGNAHRVNSDIGKLEAVTAADVQRVARQYLPENRRVVIRYMPDSARPPGSIQPDAAQDPSSLVGARPLKGDVQAPLAPAALPTAPPAQGPPVAANLPTPVERTLANGLRVIVVHSTALPLVSAKLSVAAGGAADPPGKAGLADLTASMLIQGAGERSATQMAADIDALGAKIESGATWDGSSVTLNVATARLKPALTILADAVRRPTFAADELERLRSRTLDSLKVDLQEPGNLARYVAAESVFAGSSYGHLLDGDPTSLAAINQGDLVALHETWYRPDNATLVLAGDITPEVGFSLAQQAFGDWARPTTPLAPVAITAPNYKPRVIVVDLPGTGQAAVTISLPAIARSDPRFYAASLANNVLGGGYSARLNEEVRVKRGLSYGAGSAIDPRRGVGPFVAAAQTKNESAPEVVDVMLAEMTRLGAAAPDDAELAVRKAALTGGFGRRIETTQGLAGYLSDLALQGVDLGELKRYQPGIEAVSAQAVQDFAQGAIDAKRATVVVAGDAKLFVAKLRERFPDLQVIPAATLDLDKPPLK